MKDLGKKHSMLAEPAVSDKNNIYYPSVTLNAKQIPEIENYKVGSKVKLEFVGRVSSINSYKDGDTTVSVELMKGECYKNGKEKKEDE